MTLRDQVIVGIYAASSAILSVLAFGWLWEQWNMQDFCSGYSLTSIVNGWGVLQPTCSDKFSTLIPSYLGQLWIPVSQSIITGLFFGLAVTIYIVMLDHALGYYIRSKMPQSSRSKNK